VNVSHWLDVVGGRFAGGSRQLCIEHPTLQCTLGIQSADRAIAYSTECDPSGIDFAILNVERHRCHGEGKVTCAPTELGEPDLRGSRQDGNARLGEQFDWFQVGREHGLEKLRRWNGARPIGALGNHFCVEERTYNAPFGGWVGVSQASTKGTPDSYWHVPNLSRSHSQQMTQWVVSGSVLQLHMTNKGADAQAAVSLVDIVQFLYRVDIDEHLWPGQPEIHSRYQALTACQHFRSVAVLAQ
jgi:hypothetical protein